MRLRLVVVAALALVTLAACGGDSGSSDEPALRIVAGSENQTLEPIVQRWADDRDVSVEVDYLGSVDIMLGLERGDLEADAVWPANGMWIELGDGARRTKSAQSIMRSPVVLGVKRSVAERLGWVGRDVRVEEILGAAEAGQFRLMMTSATQSNSGASAYLGFLYAFAGNPEVLTSSDLARPEVREKIRRILGTVDRTSGSSGWLKDLFLGRYDDFDAMVNYESVIIEADQALEEAGREPLYAVYPVDGLTIADSPLAFVDRGDAEKEERFGQLQEYLLSEEVQAEILGLGRRTGPIGLAPQGADPAVFNPDWGIDLDRVISPIRFPQAEVIREALDLYQTTFRKASFTVLCLDFSGSMEGRGETDLTAAMRTLLDQDEARRVLLQGSADDVTVVIPFDDVTMEVWVVEGNDPANLDRLYADVEGLAVDGGTNIYDPVIDGLRVMGERGVGDRFPSVILMTDGRANNGSFAALEAAYREAGLDVPVYGILFGDADRAQLEEITALTGGRVFDGTTDLVDAFRQAKGYN